MLIARTGGTPTGDRGSTPVAGVVVPLARGAPGADSGKGMFIARDGGSLSGDRDDTPVAGVDIPLASGEPGADTGKNNNHLLTSSHSSSSSCLSSNFTSSCPSSSHKGSHLFLHKNKEVSDPPSLGVVFLS